MIRYIDGDYILYGLADFEVQALPEDQLVRHVPLPAQPSDKKPAAVVLACKSSEYFAKRLTTLGARPILLTDQFMYPGSFILHDGIEAWRRGKSHAEIRAAAGRAYARNQKISVRAATGVFTKLAN